MEKVIVAVIAAVVLWLVVPELLFPAEAQPREPLYVCGQTMPEFVVDAKAVRLTTAREALHYLYTQPFINETRVGTLHYFLQPLRVRGVQYRVWLDGGEQVNAVIDLLYEIRRRILASWRDEPQAKPTGVGIALGNVYAEYWFDPTVHQARIGHYLATLYTSQCE
jgi:hypothetical protein